MKDLYTAHHERDRETGARLVPRPGYQQRDFERGARWEDDVREALRSGRIQKPERVSGAVRRRLSRAKGLMNNGRQGRVRDSGKFVVETTKAHKKRLNGGGQGGWYTGCIEMDSGRLVGGHCNCPDYLNGAAELRGFAACKHMMWAAMKYKEEYE
jgi:predicted nucleic acid-binding Zn finger protein